MPGPFAEFTLHHDYSQSVDRLWRAWTDPSEFAQWAWGLTAKNPKAETDVRVGGAYHLYVDNAKLDEWPKPRIGMIGFYTVVEPNRRLQYTAHWDASVFYNVGATDIADELITIEFEPNAVTGGCRVTYRHQGIPDDGHSVGGHKEATTAVLDDLAKHLGGQ